MKRRTRLLLLGSLAQLALGAASAQGPDDSEPVNCIRLAMIDRTEIIDESRIVFYMRNDDIYINNLDFSCPDLRRGRPFSYQTRSSRLCSVDVITILQTFASGLSRGGTCRLGQFSPTNEELLALLKGEEEEGDVTVVPIEVDPDEVEPVDDDE